MGMSSSERAWASRARRKPISSLTAEERERLASYNHRRRGRGRPPSTAARSSAGEPAAPAPAAAGVRPLQEPPASDPPPQPEAGGQGGGGPPIDLGATPANDEASGAPGAEDAAAAAAAQAAAERAALVKFAADYIGEMLRKCSPIIRAAELPIPPLPEMFIGVTVKCWEVTLNKWLPAEMGDPSQYAELVACSTTGYQLVATWWAGKRLQAKANEVPAGDAATAAAPASSAPPPAHANGTARPRGTSLWGAGMVDVAAKPSEKSA